MSNYRTIKNEMLDMMYLVDAMCRLVCSANNERRRKTTDQKLLKTRVLKLAYQFSMLIEVERTTIKDHEYAKKYLSLTKKMVELRGLFSEAEEKKLLAVVRKNKSDARTSLHHDLRIFFLLEKMSIREIENL